MAETEVDSSANASKTSSTSSSPVSSPTRKHYSHSLKEDVVMVPTSDGIELEARVCKQASTGNPRHNVCVLVSHPYGPLGGNLRNNVVEAVVYECMKLGLSTCRFNFRGCGKSGSRTSWNGTPELADMITMGTYCVEQMKCTRLLLVGYSYGSMMACAAAKALIDNGVNVVGLVAISYPSSVMWFLTSGNSSAFTAPLQALNKTPKLFLMGTSDNFTSISAHRQFVESIPLSIQFLYIAVTADLDKPEASRHKLEDYTAAIGASEGTAQMRESPVKNRVRRQKTVNLA
ncbi:hypothetical protein SmJEL517_g02410 [Synchytrium microbalum]|uniref:KANL3/Tex30 alpha/beta hydrolase-like domain-containing protein n=1 Tax=Synchytrium microbalum TaxID=1806994 RepID=A0A507C710_9FUNG|nr:uncharacterized protein SmJEL517_g02410 [Synchytrium microbalum]TPX35128.1 hypothetical protein SmJEL517_g02410 [Synchytrium microbalum]